MLLIWKQILENPVYQKKEELLFVLNQRCIIVFGDIGLKVNIHNAYTQKQTNKQKIIQDFIKIHIPCMNTENL